MKHPVVCCDGTWNTPDSYLRAAGLGAALLVGLAQSAQPQEVFGRVHVENGLAWIDRGVPYTASAAVQIAFSLAPGATEHSRFRAM